MPRGSELFPTGQARLGDITANSFGFGGHHMFTLEQLQATFPHVTSFFGTEKFNQRFGYRDDFPTTTPEYPFTATEYHERNVVVTIQGIMESLQQRGALSGFDTPTGINLLIGQTTEKPEFLDDVVSGLQDEKIAVGVTGSYGQACNNLLSMLRDIHEIPELKKRLVDSGQPTVLVAFEAISGDQVEDKSRLIFGNGLVVLILNPDQTLDWIYSKTAVKHDKYGVITVPNRNPVPSGDVIEKVKHGYEIDPSVVRKTEIGFVEGTDRFVSHTQMPESEDNIIRMIDKAGGFFRQLVLKYVIPAYQHYYLELMENYGKLGKMVNHHPSYEIVYKVNTSKKLLKQWSTWLEANAFDPKEYKTPQMEWLMEQTEESQTQVYMHSNISGGTWGLAFIEAVHRGFFDDKKVVPMVSFGLGGAITIGFVKRKVSST